MASDKLMNHTQGETIIGKLTSIADSLDDLAAVTPAKLGMGIATCDTPASTAAKTAALANFALVEGAPVSVQFTYANTATNATLNINNTGAKPIIYKDAAIGNDVISAGDTCTFIYTTNTYKITNIDTLTGPGSGTVRQVGAENGLITDQNNNADIQTTGKIGLKLKSDTAFSTEVGAHNTSTDNMYPVALDSEGHPVAAISNFVGSGSGHKAGLVPDTGSSTAGTAKYLREDASWIEPTGDNLKLTGYEIESQAAAVAATDTINEGIGKLEYKVNANQTNILSVEDMVCDNEFDTATAYAVGDVVTYEHGLYKFNTAHAAGVWNSSQVDEVSAVDLISSGSGTDSVASKEIYVTKPINQPDTWETKTWTGLTSFRGDHIWTDGENIYYSVGSNQYVLNKETSTWSTKTWSGLTSFIGSYVWTDGENIYFSYGSNQYVLNKETSTWSTKTWSGLTSFVGSYVWTDGTDIYYSVGSTQYVLNKETSTWSTKTWSGLTSFIGPYVWTDGMNIYCSDGSPELRQYVLDKATFTWETKTWGGLTEFYGQSIWTDGTDVYFSNGSTQYVLDKATSTWSTKTWSGLTSFIGSYVWTDGTDIYYSDGSTQYILKRPLKTTKIPDVKNNAQLTALIGDINSVLEAVL